MPSFNDFNHKMFAVMGQTDKDALSVALRPISKDAKLFFNVLDTASFLLSKAYDMLSPEVELPETYPAPYISYEVGNISRLYFRDFEPGNKPGYRRWFLHGSLIMGAYVFGRPAICIDRPEVINEGDKIVFLLTATLVSSNLRMELGRNEEGKYSYIGGEKTIDDIESGFKFCHHIREKMERIKSTPIPVRVIEIANNGEYVMHVTNGCLRIDKLMKYEKVDIDDVNNLAFILFKESKRVKKCTTEDELMKCIESIMKKDTGEILLDKEPLKGRRGELKALLESLLQELNTEDEEVPT